MMMITDAVRYVAREIAVDGEEGGYGTEVTLDLIKALSLTLSSFSGSSLEQIKGYIVEAAGKSDDGEQIPLDDAFRTFVVRSLLSQHSSVLLTTGKAGSEVKAEEEAFSLDRLRAKHGDRLRFMASEHAVKVAIAGNIDLSAPLMSMLQCVVRNRGKGTSFPALCKQLKITTSLVWFQVKSLCDLGLLVKTRDDTGKGPSKSHAIAVQYAHLSPLLTAQRMVSTHEGQTETSGSQASTTTKGKRKRQNEEENEEDEDGDEGDDLPDLRLTDMSQRTLRHLTRASAEEGDVDDTLLGDEPITSDYAASNQPMLDERDTSGLIKLEGLLAFPELMDEDAIRALSHNKQQLRYRILKLVSESRSMTTTVRGLTIRLGARRCSGFDWRAMRTEVRPMVDEGLLEFVPALDRTEKGEEVLVKCLRTTEKGLTVYQNYKISPHHRELRKIGQMLSTQLAKTRSEIALEAPIERQILERIARSGARGTTIELLHMIFGGSGERRRDIDRWLNAMKDSSLPQYRDLYVDSSLEQAGRVRLSRFWTYFWIPAMVIESTDERKRKKNGEADYSPARILADLSSPVMMPLEVPSARPSIQTLDLLASGRQNAGVATISGATPSGSRGSPMGTESGEIHAPSMLVRPKGRPRKNFTQEAIDKANKNRLAKGLPPLPPENRVPPSEVPASPPKRAKSAGRKSLPTGVAGSAESQTPQVEMANLNAQSLLSLKSTPREAGADQGSQVEEDRVPNSATAASHESEAAAQSHSQNGMVMLPARQGNKVTRSNLTVQLKFDKMREFFDQVHVIEGTLIDRAYQRFVQDTVAQESRRPPYEMDAKVRKRLLTALEKAGAICSKNAVGPPSRLPGGKSSMMTLYYRADVDLRQVQSYGRRLIEEASVMFKRSGDQSWRRAAPIDALQVDMPTGRALTGRTTSSMLASSLDELIKDPRYRAQLASQASIRAFYAGRIAGFAARMQFFHQTVWDLLSAQGTAEESSLFVVDRDGAIVDLQWWYTDATLSQILALVTPPNDEAVLLASQDEEKLKTPLSKLDRSIRDHFDISEKEEGGLRDSLSAIMHMLVVLGLATPHIETTDEGEAEANWPIYRFAPSSRILAWSLESANSPLKLVRTWQTVYFSDAEQGKRFWIMFSRAAIFDNRRRPASQQAHEGEDVELEDSVSAVLASPTSWFNTYKMMRAQVHFFDRSIQLGVTPAVLQDTELLQRLSFNGVVPISIVKRFYMRRFNVPSKKQQSRLADKALTAIERKTGSFKMTKPQRIRMDLPPASQRAVFPMTKRQAKKVQREARRSRQEKKKEFDELVEEFMDEQEIDVDEREILLEGLQRARQAYANGQGFMTMDHVKAILASIQRLHVSGESDSYNALVRQTTSSRARRLPKTGPRNARADAPEAEKVGRKRAGRKSGFEWTTDMDELLRDCGVILRARDRFRNSGGTGRKNWAALKQVFPTSGNQALLSRFMKLQAAVGEEAYLAQLEVAWTKLWTGHRGTHALADDNPRDPTAFDLREHVNFLRANISKHEVIEILRRGADDPLPLDVGLIVPIYDLERPATVSVVANPNILTPRYVHADPQNEMRGDILERSALSEHMFYGATPSSDATCGSETTIGRAMAVVKMILSTNDAHYDESVATQLCKDNSTEADINRALRALRFRSVLKHKSSEGRQAPDRNLAYTDDWQSFMSDQALEALPPWQTISFALRAFGRDSEDGHGKSLFQVITDADAAAFISLADEGAVDIQLDTGPIAQFSHNRLFNAKKLTDADLELPLTFAARDSFDTGLMLSDRFKLESLLEGGAIPDRGSRWLQHVNSDDRDVHRRLWRSAYEAVRRDADLAHLDAAFATIRDALERSGERGLSRSDVGRLHSPYLPFEDLIAAIDALQAAHPPLVFESDQDDLHLTASSYAIERSVRLPNATSAGTAKHVISHLWLDIYGRNVGRVWHDALALVLYAIFVRPGVTLAQVVAHMTAGALTSSDVRHLVDCIFAAGLIQLRLSHDPNVTGSMALWQAQNDAQISLDMPRSISLP